MQNSNREHQTNVRYRWMNGGGDGSWWRGGRGGGRCCCRVRCRCCETKRISILFPQPSAQDSIYVSSFYRQSPLLEQVLAKKTKTKTNRFDDFQNSKTDRARAI